MYATLHIPHFSLAVLLRDDPAALTTPMALLDTTGPDTRRSTPQVLAVNRVADRAGISCGMTSTRALARCSRIHFLTPDPARKCEHQNRLRDFAVSLTPDFEESAPGTILLDLLTLPQARQAPRDWIEQTLRKASALRLPLHLSLATTPDLALLAARHPSTSSHLSFTPEPALSIQESVADTRSLSGLPLTQIADLISPIAHREAQDPKSKIQDPRSPLSDLDLLTLWGLHTLGDLAALPYQGLAERLGPDVARLHDIIHGKHHRLLTLHRPPEHFQVTHELDYPLDTLEPLLFLLRRNLDTLCARIGAAQRAVQGIHFSLTFDDGDLHLRELHIPDPTRDPSILLRLLHTHLDTVTAPSPVIAFHLKLLPTLPAEAQHDLFERSLRDPNKFADTLARIEALLGPGRLGTPIPLDTHKPDAFALRPPMGNPRQAPSDAPDPHSTLNIRRSAFDVPTALPLRRFRPPIEIHVASESHGHHHHPLALLDGPHPGPITATHGPFPLSGHWWNPAERWQRTEWDIRLTDHTLLRLAHLPPERWILEGVYG